MDNKRLISEYFAALSGRPKTADLVERYVSDAALAEHIAQVEAAFPRYELIPHHVIAENDLVAVRATFRGQHTGTPFAGIEPAGKDASGEVMIIYRFDNGRIAQHWMQFDAAALVAQLQPAVAQAVA